IPLSACMVLVDEIAPAAVAELARALRRTDDVRKEDGRKDAIRLDGLAHAGQELLDLGEDFVAVDPRQWSMPGNSTYLAAATRRASQRAFSTWQTASSVRWMMKPLAHALVVLPARRDVSDAQSFSPTRENVLDR